MGQYDLFYAGGFFESGLRAKTAYLHDSYGGLTETVSSTNTNIY